MLDAGRHTISSHAQLRELFGEPLPRVISKEMPALDEATRGFIACSPFLVMATTAADGSCDAGPKGGPPGFVRVLSDTRLLIPEFPGNRRFDGVQNLVERRGIGLLFVVPGISETLRVNGFAHLTRDPDLLAQCGVDGRRPWFVTDVQIEQVFSHCGKAFIRSELWRPERWPDADEVSSPSKSIAASAAESRRRQSEVRREVEESYEPVMLYGEAAGKEPT
jgi:PPOX class probable FMN-dependent enzyme